MNKLVNILKETGVFYVATEDGEQPRVRPFGAVAEINERAYFSTNNTKDVYKQLIANPKTEICGSLKDGSWVRVTGKFVRDNNDVIRTSMLEEVPYLKNIFTIGDGIFEVFYLEDPIITVYSLGKEPERIY